jgi:hypothetical protein
MQEALIPVRCRGCHRTLGIGPANPRIFCDAWCAGDYPTVAGEARDALIEAIHLDQGILKPLLAARFGMSRQRIDQILKFRDIRRTR